MADEDLDLTDEDRVLLAFRRLETDGVPPARWLTSLTENEAVPDLLDVAGRLGNVGSLVISGTSNNNVFTQVTPVQITDAGKARAAALVAVGNDPERRLQACSRRMLRWFYDEGAYNQITRKSLREFTDSPKAQLLGCPFTDDEITRTFHELKERGLLGDSSAQGNPRGYCTPLGADCVRHHGADVSKMTAPTSSGLPSTVTFNTVDQRNSHNPTGQIAGGTATANVQNAETRTINTAQVDRLIDRIVDAVRSTVPDPAQAHRDVLGELAQQARADLTTIGTPAASTDRLGGFLGYVTPTLRTLSRTNPTAQDLLTDVSDVQQALDPFVED